MSKIEKILVCLDRSQYDEKVLEYASMIATKNATENTYFLTAWKENLDTTIKKELNAKVEQYFNAETEKEVQILQGSEASDLLKWRQIKDIDLIIIGIKPKGISSGKSAMTLINGAPCSVMLVPFTATLDIKKALIPIDFSKSAKLSMEMAIGLKTALDMELLLQHVYYVSSGYTTSGKSYEEFAKVLEKNSEKDYRNFMRELELNPADYSMMYTLDEDSRPADNIYDAAKENNVDLIIIGSKGRTKLASLISKSTAVSLVKYDQDIPYLVVKEKKSSLGFFGALLRI